MPEEPQQPVKKYVTSACVVCRRRKVKCDGNVPSCSTCQNTQQQCVYNQEDDKRKSAPRKLVNSLIGRIKLLERLLESHNVEIPPYEKELLEYSSFRVALSATREEDQSPTNGPAVRKPSDMDADFARDRPKTLQNPAAQPSSGSGQFDGFESLQADLSPGIGSDSLLHSTTGAFNDLFDASVASDTSPEGGFMVDSAFPGDTDFSANEGFRSRDVFLPPNTGSNPDVQSLEIMDQLSARMGSFQIAEDGQLRYFGATSNLHILHNGSFSLSRYPTRSLRTEGPVVLERAGLNLQVNPDVESYLEKLYFSWEDPAIHVVDEAMYFEGKGRYESGISEKTYYSETLKNAICAIGAHLSPRTDLGVPSPAAEFFSSRAKTLLEIEMDSPTVATVQALVIMSAIEAASTRDARGWLYSGMAVRLSSDLGLHLDLTSQLKQDKLSAREIDVRRTTFWGVFIHESMWTLYLGRSQGISMDNVSVSRPAALKDDIHPTSWRPVSDFVDDGEKNMRLPDPINSCTDSNVTLAVMMGHLSRNVYSGKALADQDVNTFVAQMSRMCDEWLATLPSNLHVDLQDTSKVYLPHILQLHMQFYTIKIFIYRPLFAAHVTGTGGTKTQLGMRARDATFEAASASTRHLERYREQYGLRKVNVHMVHLVFTAALIHIFETCTSTGKRAETAMSYLQTCTQALSEIGQSYRNSTRALEVIICIKREWQDLASVMRSKRPGSMLDGPDDREHAQRRKRAMSSNWPRNDLRRSYSMNAASLPGDPPVHNFDDMASMAMENQDVFEAHRFSFMPLQQQYLAAGQGQTAIPQVSFTDEGINLLNSLG